MIKEKLVRDKISEFSDVKKDGRKFRKISVAERLHFLSEKILEEAKEVQDAMFNGTHEQVCEELGDVLDVVEAIMEWRGIPHDELETTQFKKKQKKGGFETFTVMEISRFPDETI